MCAVACVHDIHAYSCGKAEQKRHARAALQQLLAGKRGVHCQLRKRVFGRSLLRFPAHRVTAGGATPLASDVRATVSRPALRSVTERQALLGLVNHVSPCLGPA